MNLKKYLFLSARDEFYRLDISKIVYFEADGNYTNFLLSNKQKGSVLMNLSKMQNLLSESLKDDAKSFARIGKSLIINLNFVYHIVPLRQKLILSDGEQFSCQLTVSKEALKKLKDLYTAPFKPAKPAAKPQIESGTKPEDKTESATKPETKKATKPKTK